MDDLNGSLKTEIKLDSASLAFNPDFPHKINQRIAPGISVTSENAHFRLMFLASDKVNAHRGCFPAAELQKIAELIPGSPVLIGHRRDHLPIARCFDADQLVDSGGVNWVRAYFYWMKDALGASTLQLNIDSGIYKECSLCFSYTMPECSICGNDFRACPHSQMEEYALPDGSAVRPFYYYRGIKDVLEISLVYRGANPGTKIIQPANQADGQVKGLKITANSKYGHFDLCLNSGDDFPLHPGKNYTCPILELHQDLTHDGFHPVECRAYLEIKNGIPSSLHIEDSPLNGMYHFERIKSQNKYHLTLSKKE